MEELDNLLLGTLARMGEVPVYDFVRGEPLLEALATGIALRLYDLSLEKKITIRYYLTKDGVRTDRFWYSPEGLFDFVKTLPKEEQLGLDMETTLSVVDNSTETS